MISNVPEAVIEESQFCMNGESRELAVKAQKMLRYVVRYY